MKYTIDAHCIGKENPKRVSTDSLEEIKNEFKEDAIHALKIHRVILRTEEEKNAFIETLQSLFIIPVK